ncbi:DUF4260 domain-containing protein [Saccharicrinis sp. FJH2]|uniref:DUF4260 domain-containing protein n=1 Tax=Saccharicrinis sp. FJH65 TaxID=3344659 RepID=UPI0035F4DEAA
MKLLLQIEETSMLALSFYLSLLLGYKWWIFILFLFVPDLSMLAYFFGNRTGAFIYNLFHYKFLAVILGISGYLISLPSLAFAGTILFGHSSFDRIFGYGLKFKDDFKHTHLSNNNKFYSK